MEHRPIAAAPSDAVLAGDRLSARPLMTAAWGSMALAALTAIHAAMVEPRPLVARHVFDGDLYLLLGAAGALVLLARTARRGPALRPLRPAQAGLLVLLVALVARVGSDLVMERFGASRDEQIAEFTAAHLQRGLWGEPVPAALRPLSLAMLPNFASLRGHGGWWLGDYYPINSAVRAMTGWLLGDRWLAGPLLLALGLAGLWRAARVLWPDRPEAPTVALVLGATSSQLLANAMTPYAMTAQFAAEAWWLAAVMARGWRAQAAAALIGLLATGVHQAHFHPQFALGMVGWLWLSGRRRDAAFQVIAVALAWAFWDRLYRHALLDHVFGPGAASPLVGQLSYVGRLLDIDPIPNIARFIAWQNVLLAPLALVGARAALRERPYPATWGMAVSCAIGLVLTVDDGLGFGYRYLTGLLPCCCLLAADGWRRLDARGARWSGAALWAGAGVALLVAAPFASWRAHADVHPYAAAYRLARAAPADAVLVDARGAAFLQDVVRFDDPGRKPLLLDLAKVPMSALPDLCRGRVMILDRRQALALGMAGDTTQPDAARAAPRRAWLAHARCGTPLPIPG